MKIFRVLAALFYMALGITVIVILKKFAPRADWEFWSILLSASIGCILGGCYMFYLAIRYFHSEDIDEAKNHSH